MIRKNGEQDELNFTKGDCQYRQVLRRVSVLGNDSSKRRVHIQHTQHMDLRSETAGMMSFRTQ